MSGRGDVVRGIRTLDGKVMGVMTRKKAARRGASMCCLIGPPTSLTHCINRCLRWVCLKC